MDQHMVDVDAGPNPAHTTPTAPSPTASSPKPQHVQPTINQLAIGPLWIRRQLFEHSVTIPTLTSSNASQIDFKSLINHLISVSVVPPPAPPVVTYDDWIAAAGLYARLDSSRHASIIIEALQINVPHAFRALNTHSAHHLDYLDPDNRNLLIPVPELVVFIKLHAAATITNNFRTNAADSVWPEFIDLRPEFSHNINVNSFSLSPGQYPSNPISLSPTSPKIQQPQLHQHPQPQPQPPVLQNPAPSTKQIIDVDPNRSTNNDNPIISGTNSNNSTNINNKNDSQLPNSSVQPPPQLDMQQLEPQHKQLNPKPSQSLQQSPSSSSTTNTPTQSSPRQQQQIEVNTLNSIGVGVAGGLDSLVRKKSPGHIISPIMNSQSIIIASGQNAMERETKLVIKNLKGLLLAIASTYGITIENRGIEQKLNTNISSDENPRPNTPANSAPPPTSIINDDGEITSNNNAATGGRENEAAESGTLSSVNTVNADDKNTSSSDAKTATKESESADVTKSAITPGNSTTNNSDVFPSAKENSNDDAVMEDGNNSSSNSNNDTNHVNETAAVTATSIVSSASTFLSNWKPKHGPLHSEINKIQITKEMFEHLSFLFTTSSHPDGSFRPMTTIVPQWKDGDSSRSIGLCDLMDVIAIALTRVATVDPPEGVIDVIDINDLERKTVIRTVMPRTNERRGVSKSELKNGSTIICDEMKEDENAKEQDGENQTKSGNDNNCERNIDAQKDQPTETNNNSMNNSGDSENEEDDYKPDVRIWNCTDSNLYLLCALGRVSFIGCRGCTLFIGGCISLSLINCENVRVHSVSRMCRVTNCFDTHLYLCTNNKPKIIGENRGLVFAPYNAVYPRTELDKHLKFIGVDLMNNKWDQFYRPTVKFSGNTNSINNINNNEIPLVVARKLTPEQFLPFAVPIKYREGTIIGDGVDEDEEEDNGDNRDEKGKMRGKWDSSLKCLFGVCVPLPKEYAEELKQRRLQVVKVRKEIRELEKKWRLGTFGNNSSSKDVTMDVDSENENEPNEDIDDNESESSRDNLRRQLPGGIIHSIIQDRFRDWLTHSGRIRQISDLVRMAQES